MSTTFERILELIERQEVRILEHGYDELMKKKAVKYIHEGEYVAKVEVDLLTIGDEWSPYLSLGDAYKLDEIRRALQMGNLERAIQLADVFTLTPIAA